MSNQEYLQIWMNPPLVATPQMAKVISAQLGKPGAVMEMKVDNRYRNGNIKIVKGVVRGNKDTISLKPVTEVEGMETHE